MEKIKQLREKTGAGVMDAKKALEESGGDMKKAEEIIAAKGIVKAEKKADREVKSGLVYGYTHQGRVGVLVEVSCETDFVAKNPLFKELAHDLALQVAAMSPIYVSPDNIPEEIINKEKEAHQSELKDSNKPEKIINQIIEGKLQKWYQEICLIRQPFIKNPDQMIDDILKEYIAKIGENIKINRFVRFEI